MRFPTSEGMLVVEAGPVAASSLTTLLQQEVQQDAQDVQAVQGGVRDVLTHTAQNAAAVPQRKTGPRTGSTLRTRWRPGLHPPLLGVGGVLPVAEFWHRATAVPADNDITLCTQLDTLGLKYLIRLAEEWRGPLSVASYLPPWQTGAQLKEELLADPRYVQGMHRDRP